MTPRRKAIYSALALVLFLVLLEAVLRLFGIARPERPFSESRNAQGVVMARVELNQMHDEFPREKPANTYRLMIAGASTVVGFPYQPHSSFALRLEEMLKAALPDVNIEVINLGRMSYYSGEVASVVHEALQYHPDIMIVYTGNNEFISLARRKAKDSDVLGRALGGLRIFRASRDLATGIKAHFENRLKDPDAGLVIPPPPPISKEDYERALREFKQNLETMTHDCEAEKVPLLICTPIINLSDWPPYRYAFPAGMNEQDRAAALDSLAKGEALVERGESDRAVDLLNLAVAKSQGYAALHFELGRAKDSRPEFSRAVSLEARSVVTHRAIPEFNQIIRALGNDHGFGVVDLDDSVRLEARGSDTPGLLLFDDQRHPNLLGQQVIADHIYHSLESSGMPFTDRPWKSCLVSEEQFRARHALDHDFLYNVYLGMAIFDGVKAEGAGPLNAVAGLLEKATREKPEEPMPDVLESLLWRRNGFAAKTAGRLSNFYLKNPSSVESLVKRHFTSRVDLQDGFFMARIEKDHNPPFQGLVREDIYKRIKEKGEDISGPKAPLDYYNCFLDLTHGGEDVTEQVLKSGKLERK